MSFTRSSLAALTGAGIGAAYGLVDLALGGSALALLICPILFATIVPAAAIAAPTPIPQPPAEHHEQREPCHK